jgi:hypothetical protein
MEPTLQIHPLRWAGHAGGGGGAKIDCVTGDRVGAVESVDPDHSTDTPGVEPDLVRGVRVDRLSFDLDKTPRSIR